MLPGGKEEDEDWAFGAGGVVVSSPSKVAHEGRA